MTIDECRDRIAVLLGWRTCERGFERDSGMGVTTVALIHPVPDTVDGITDMWPVGWSWMVYRYSCSTHVVAEAWYGPSPLRNSTFIQLIHATEYEARLRLLLAVLEQQNNPMTGDSGKEKR